MADDDVDLMDTIDTLIVSSRDAYQNVKDKLGEVTQVFREQLDRARALRTTASEYIALFELIVANSNVLVTEADVVRDMFERIGSYTERIEGLTEQVKTIDDQVNQALDQVEQVIDDTLQQGVTDFHSIIDDNVSTHEQFTEETAERLENKVHGVLGNIGQKRDEAVERLDQVLLAEVPALFNNETAEFVEKVELLQSKGLAQVGKITGILGEITEKTEKLTELIETAKPILDYARQVL